MEKPVSAQISGIPHLLLRVALGLFMMSAAVMIAFMITLWIIFSEVLASKYGSPFENIIIAPMLIAVVGAIPSVFAGFTVMVKNKASLRNPQETAFAGANLILFAVFMKLSFQYNPPNSEVHEALILAPVALLYFTSAVAIIRLAQKASQNP